MHRFGKVGGILTCLVCFLSISVADASSARAQEARVDEADARKTRVESARGADARADRSTDHAITGTELQRAIGAEAAGEAAQRARLKRLLSNEAVGAVGEQAGLDVDRARNAVEMLEGAGLDRASSLAADAEEQLVGGQSTVTISTTAIIIVLLLLILVAVA